MRALLLILDSVGIGGAPDAAQYGDAGADTLPHILEQCPKLQLPTLWSLGLGHVLQQAPVESLQGSYGQMHPQSKGKDSTTGHWEIAGVILDEPFTVFEEFPSDLVRSIEAECNVQFIGNYPRSGTEILKDLGELHLRTGHPILYTSADSVLQIAAHEEVIPLTRLYEICTVARRHCDAYRIARVIARPFVGEPGHFTRTAGRHDFSMKPPRTVLNALIEAELPVISIGKVADLFADEGISESHPSASNEEGMHKLEEVWHTTKQGLVFANLVDFDMLYGHRRDVIGYANALQQFDVWLHDFLPLCNADDLIIITADHGNDPTFHGSDHTREVVPLLVKYKDRQQDLGCRQTFADIAASLAQFFELREPWPVGEPVFDISR